MPTRLIREGWLESEAIDSLTPAAERFFLRLCLRADDFGRYYANEQIIKSSVFPLKNDVKNSDVNDCLLECEKAGLLVRYKVGGKPYIQINKFNQRTRANKSKFPSPTENDGHLPVICPSHDRHLPVKADFSTVNIEESPKCPSHDGHLPVICPSHDGLDGGGGGCGDGGGCGEGQEGGKGSFEEKKTSRKLGVISLPENWEPNAAHEALAKERGLNLSEAVGFFRDWAEAGGKRYASWDACFRNALKSWLPEKLGRNGAGRPNVKMHPLDAARRLEAIKVRMQEISANMPRFMPDGSKSYGKFRDKTGSLKPEAQAELSNLKADAESLRALSLSL